MPAILRSPQITEYLGERIRTARLRAQLSQSELGERVGVSQPTVAHWERGVHAPKPSHMSAVARVLNAPDLTPYPTVPPAPTVPNDAEKRRYLARAIRHVPVLDWPSSNAPFDPAAAPAFDHVAASLETDQPFALTCEDPAMARAFPPTTVVIFDAADRTLAEGAYHLVLVAGRYLIRRWRVDPDRLEAAGEGVVADTIFPKTRPQSFGRAVMACRLLDGSAPLDR